MTERVYAGMCDAGNLDGHLRALGLMKGSRFFGVSVNEDPLSPQIIVYVADDLTEEEAALVDEAVEESFPQMSSTPPDLPVGSIIAFNRLFGGVPSGYNLCDGSHGTPDLRSSFADVVQTVYE